MPPLATSEANSLARSREVAVIAIKLDLAEIQKRRSDIAPNCRKCLQIAFG